MRVYFALLLASCLLQVACSSTGGATKAPASTKQAAVVVTDSENTQISYAMAHETSMKFLADLWVCLAKNAKSLDDKISDASTIASAVSETCTTQFDAYNKVFCFASSLKHKDVSANACLSVMDTARKRRELSLQVVLKGRTKQQLPKQETKL